MIELGKEYRTASPVWTDIAIHEIKFGYVYGRVGAYPVSWLEHSGAVSDLPKSVAEYAFDWALVEVLPEVTVRRKVYDVFGECRVVGDATSVTGEGFPKTGVTFLGPIDITHNGKEITDVRVVK